MTPEAYNCNKYASGVFCGKKSMAIDNDLFFIDWNVSSWK